MQTSKISYIKNLKSDYHSIAIVFNYGYKNEDSKNNGAGHLFEHYAVSFYKKLLNCNYVYGEADYRNIKIFIYLDKKNNIETEVEKIKTSLNIIHNIDREIFNIESSRVRLELEDLISEKFNTLSEKIQSMVLQKKLLIKNKLQLSNLEKMDIDKFKINLNKILNSGARIMIGDDSKNKLKNKLESKDENNFENKISKEKVFLSSNKILDNLQKEVITKMIIFKGYSVFDPIEKIEGLKFLTRNIYNQINGKSAEYGSYSIDFSNMTESEFGLFWFMSRSYILTENDFSDDVLSIFNNFIKTENLNEKLKIFKEERISTLSDLWNDPFDRFEWIVEDILDYGICIDFSERKQKIQELNINILKEIIKEVLGHNILFKN